MAETPATTRQPRTTPKPERAPRGSNTLNAVKQYCEMRCEVLADLAGNSETTTARIEELKKVLAKMEGGK
jgi:hypothetical protein